MEGTPIRGLGQRLLRHAWVLGAAVATPVLAPHAVTHLPVIPVVAGLDGGSATPAGVTLDRRPLTLAVVARPAQIVVSRPGDTVESLAASFHAEPNTLGWANGLAEGTPLPPGSAMLVPPGRGALVPVLPEERPSHFAARLGLDARVILDYNNLRHDTGRPAGSFLQVPADAAPSGSLPSIAVVQSTAGVPEVDPAQDMVGGGSSAGGRFPWGQCTWYVSTRRLVPWNGDAATWFRNAQSFGRPEGRVPVAGAIAVIATNAVGHVAYVERVNPDGSFVISEENYPVLGQRDERTVTVSSIALIGFIY